MNITIKYFASLKESMDCAEQQMEVEEKITVGDLWQTLATDHHVEVAKILMAVNMIYVKPEQVLHEGDEVAFFPPVTGG